MKEIISDWLEEGFSNFDESLSALKREDSFFPFVVNNKGENIAPKPLFPVYLNEVEIDSNFLVEYLEVIQHGLSYGKYTKSKSSSTSSETNKLMVFESNKYQTCSIEFERKNIFLSRKIFPLFEISDTFVSNNSPNYQSVLSKNQLYKTAVEFHTNMPQEFCEQFTQVERPEMKEKQIDTAPIVFADKGHIVNSYLMEKYFTKKEIPIKPYPKTFEQFISSRTKFRDSKELNLKISEDPNIIKTIKNHLYIIEKTLDYNTYEKTITSYFKLNDIFIRKSECNDILESEQLDASKNFQERINLQMEFSMSLLKGYRVSCIECNPSNPCLFICGYGISSSEEMDYDPRGIVLCWNIKKCGYPERIYYMEEAVNCIEISKSKPYEIAVGMRYGLVAVIDIRESSNNLLTNRSSKNRPIAAIKSVQWLLKEHSIDKKKEILLSLSLNGIISSWYSERKLDGDNLTTIKQIDSEFYSKQGFSIANTIAGLSMHVKPGEENIFSVGTINGKVITRNLDNPDENLDEKSCHFGSVNDIKWSSLVENVFVTCGSDGCVHFWELEKSKPSKTLYLSENILRISLSTRSSTLFSAITKNKFYIFDLAKNLHKPIIKLPSIHPYHFTFMTFCPLNDWILVGQSNAIVYLYEIIYSPQSYSYEPSLLRSIFLPQL